jgi:predicted enzyme related to lactoylglutathione lyase
MSVDLLVDSVTETARRIEQAGGTIAPELFETRIGKGAIVRDPWGNQYVILDATKAP